MIIDYRHFFITLFTGSPFNLLVNQTASTELTTALYRRYVLWTPRLSGRLGLRLQALRECPAIACILDIGARSARHGSLAAQADGALRAAVFQKRIPGSF